MNLMYNLIYIHYTCGIPVRGDNGPNVWACKWTITWNFQTGNSVQIKGNFCKCYYCRLL